MEYFIIGLFGLIIWGVILEYIIAGATKTKQRIKHDEIIIKLLFKIAEKQGVSDEELDAILPPGKEKK
jgi:hypothetical protein